MDTNTIVLIEKGLETAITLGPMAVGAAMKIKHLLELDPSFEVNLKQLTDEAIAADDDTIQAIEAWKASLPVKTIDAQPTPPTSAPSHLADSVEG